MPPLPSDRPKIRPAPANTPHSPPDSPLANSLLAATLLGFTGGTLDAFLYLNHGHVFAGAMTGNAILCGIALLGHDRMAMLHHALPLVGFLAGLALSELLQGALPRHAVPWKLLLETAGLLAASLLPATFPDPAFVFFISLVAAFQVDSFRKVDTFSYNSTFITGNIRSLVASLSQAWGAPRQRLPLRQARDLALIVFAFFLGAVAAAALAPRAGNHTLWLPVAVLLSVLLLVLRHRRTSSIV